MIKLVVSDLDGTLLDDLKNVSEKNKLAISKLEENNIKFCIATGRLDASARFIERKLESEYDIISCNGALIKESKSNKTLYRKPIDIKTAIDLTQILDKLDVKYHFYTENSVFSKTLSNSALCYHEQNLEEENQEGKIHIIISDDMIKSVHESSDILKFIVFLENDSKRVEVLETLKDIKKIEISQSTSNNIEIMSEGVSKGNAVKFISEIYKIDKSEVMVIGDQMNDLSMFDSADTKVAMGSGSEILQKVATLITKSNNEHGVAYAIDKVIFERKSE